MTDEITRRWSKPVNVVSVREVTNVIEIENGVARYGLEKVYGDQESLDRVRLGYVCLWCDEPQEQPFPEQCWLCKKPMREHQSRLFEIGHKGELHVGPSVNLADEFDRLDAEHEQDKWAEHPTLGIVVPRNTIGRG